MRLKNLGLIFFFGLAAVVSVKAMDRSLQEKELLDSKVSTEKFDSPVKRALFKMFRMKPLNDNGDEYSFNYCKRVKGEIWEANVRLVYIKNSYIREGQDLGFGMGRFKKLFKKFFNPTLGNFTKKSQGNVLCWLPDYWSRRNFKVLARTKQLREDARSFGQARYLLKHMGSQLQSVSFFCVYPQKERELGPPCKIWKAYGFQDVHLWGELAKRVKKISLQQSLKKETAWVEDPGFSSRVFKLLVQYTWDKLETLTLYKVQEKSKKYSFSTLLNKIPALKKFVLLGTKDLTIQEWRSKSLEYLCFNKKTSINMIQDNNAFPKLHFLRLQGIEKIFFDKIKIEFASFQDPALIKFLKVPWVNSLRWCYIEYKSALSQKFQDLVSQLSCPNLEIFQWDIELFSREAPHLGLEIIYKEFSPVEQKDDRPSKKFRYAEGRKRKNEPVSEDNPIINKRTLLQYVEEMNTKDMLNRRFGMDLY